MVPLLEPAGLHDVVDVEERHQLERCRENRAECRRCCRTPTRRVTRGGVAGIGEIVIDKIERDMRGVRRERQRLAGLLGHRAPWPAC